MRRRRNVEAREGLRRPAWVLTGAIFSWPVTVGTVRSQRGGKQLVRGGRACALSPTYRLWSLQQVIALSEPHFSDLQSRISIL